MFEPIKEYFWPMSPGERADRERIRCAAPEIQEKVRMVSYKAEDVFGWPSSGGMLQKKCSIVELEYLGLAAQLKTFPTVKLEGWTLRDGNVPKFNDQAAEDAFCQKMRMIGARQFKSFEQLMGMGGIGGGCMFGDGKVELDIGWPADGNGVWIGRWTRPEYFRRAFHWLKEAETMDERCQIIKQCGGSFYDDPRECPELAEVLAEVASKG